jgi:hypothetical protein
MVHHLCPKVVHHLAVTSGHSFLDHLVHLGAFQCHLVFHLYRRPVRLFRLPSLSHLLLVSLSVILVKRCNRAARRYHLLVRQVHPDRTSDFQCHRLAR